MSKFATPEDKSAIRQIESLNLRPKAALARAADLAFTVVQTAAREALMSDKELARANAVRRTPTEQAHLVRNSILNIQADNRDAVLSEMLTALRWARGSVPYPSGCHEAIVAAIAKAEDAA